MLAITEHQFNQHVQFLYGRQPHAYKTLHNNRCMEYVIAHQPVVWMISSRFAYLLPDCPKRVRGACYSDASAMLPSNLRSSLRIRASSALRLAFSVHCPTAERPSLRIQHSVPSTRSPWPICSASSFSIVVPSSQHSATSVQRTA